MKTIIESVPNFSEGQRGEVISAIVNRVKEVPGVRVLDISSDPDHNRSVLTMMGDQDSLRGAVLALFEKAVEHIDLTKHQGEHPRMGAVDVVPFVPIKGVTMDDCISLSKEVGEEIAEKFNIPVYFYEESATREERRNLAKIRKGQFEGFFEKIKLPEWQPDCGPAEVHSTAGVVAVGAREFLIAYNVNLGTDNLEVASNIAKAVRHISGGLRYVKALGMTMEERKLVQVSMNLVNYKKTPIYRVFELIRAEARRYGVTIVGSEIVGLVPNDALLGAAEYYLQIENFSPSQVIENRLAEE
ncbi:glutamate formimidoyltransferase [bacterium (candidate division B38) B3_B38]|nr:MAG: glutamate formimidoyltransferase [bacterium (candidate division B38) B3_B38]